MRSLISSAAWFVNVTAVIQDGFILLVSRRYRRWEERVYVDTTCFSYLLVDEFQDISPLEYQLIKMWNSGGPAAVFFYKLPGYRMEGTDCELSCSGTFRRPLPLLLLIMMLQAATRPARL